MNGFIGELRSLHDRGDEVGICALLIRNRRDPRIEEARTWARGYYDLHWPKGCYDLCVDFEWSDGLDRRKFELFPFWSNRCFLFLRGEYVGSVQRKKTINPIANDILLDTFDAEMGHFDLPVARALLSEGNISEFSYVMFRKFGSSESAGMFGRLYSGYNSYFDERCDLMVELKRRLFNWMMTQSGVS